MTEKAISIPDKNNNNEKLNIKSELNFFKNELLGDFKQVESKIVKKVERQNDETEKKLYDFQNKLDSITQKLFSLSNKTSHNSQLKDQVESLIQFRSKMEETINVMDFKLTTISKDLVDAINKYDRLIEKNILYEGIIGSSNARFTTFHNFIDYVLTNISQLIIFRDKTIGMDFKQYKNKIDTMLLGLKKQSDGIIEHNKIFTVRCLDNLENKIKSTFDLFEQKIFDLKINNSEQYTNLEKIAQNLIREYEKIVELKKEIEINISKNNDAFNYHFILNENRLTECLNDYYEMKKKFDLLVEYLKGLKLGSHANFNEFFNLYSQESHRKKINAESYLKKYIVGEMGMEQISMLARRRSKKNVSFADKNNNNNNNNDNNNNKTNNMQSNKFLRKTISNFEYRKNKSNIINNNLNSNNINNNNINTNNNNNDIFHLSNSQSDFMFNLNNLKESFKTNNISINSSLRENKDNIDDKNTVNNNEIRKSKSYKRYNTSNINNNMNKNKDNADELKGNKNNNAFKNNIIALNKSYNSKLERNKLNQDNNNTNLNDNNVGRKNDDKFKENDIYENKEDKENEEDKKIEKTNAINLNGPNKDIENKNIKKNNDIDNNESQKIKIKKKVKFTEANNNDIKKEEEKIVINEKEIIIEKKENNKKKDLINNNSFENNINSNNNLKKNSEIKSSIVKKNNNNIIDNKTNNKNYNNYNFNIIEEKEEEKEEIEKKESKEQKDQKDKKEKKEKNEKEEKKEKTNKKDKIEKKEQKEKQEKQEKNKVQNDYNMENIFEDKENNTIINNYENKNNLELLNNYQNYNFPTNNTIEFQESKKNYLDELDSKIKEKQNNYTIDADNKQKLINDNSKIILHKLLKGDKSALNSIKIINNGEEIKIPKIAYNDKKQKNNEKKINLNTYKTSIKSNSSINFYPNKNHINNQNFEYFDRDDNYYFFNNEINYDTTDSKESNLYFKKTKVNKMNNTEFKSTPNNNKQKLHIVNLPGINDIRKMENNSHNDGEVYNEALNQILELRKIKYDNDLYRKNKGRPIINQNNKNNMNIRFDNNRIRKTYNGFYNSSNRNYSASYDELSQRLKK